MSFAANGLLAPPAAAKPRPNRLAVDRTVSKTLPSIYSLRNISGRLLALGFRYWLSLTLNSNSLPRPVNEAFTCSAFKGSGWFLTITSSSLIRQVTR